MNDEKEHSTPPKVTFIRGVIVDGVLVMGVIFLVAMSLSDYALNYYYEKGIPQYSINYFASKFFIGAIIGCIKGFIDWLVFVNWSKKQNRINN